MGPSNVFRDKVKEGRENYFVTYQPADCRLCFATLDLVFTEIRVDNARVAQAMGKEMGIWLKRYPVPVMVSAFDVKDDLIYVKGESHESHLMGYCDLKTEQVVQRWGLFKDNELPADQASAEYLQSSYKGIGFREQAAVRDTAKRETRNLVRATQIIAFFVVGVPVLIEIVSLGVAWIGYILSAVSITTGVYKVAKTFGWLKTTAREKAEAEEESKMKHYYWHCERNKAAFERLKFENFEREIIERTRKEAETIGVNTRSKS